MVDVFKDYIMMRFEDFYLMIDHAPEIAGAPREFDSLVYHRQFIEVCIALLDMSDDSEFRKRAKMCAILMLATAPRISNIT